MATQKIIMLGTGNALVTKCFNTCFILQSDGRNLLVDTGGGNGILRQIEQSGVPSHDIHDIFITHAHTDHIMGAIWIMRIQINRAKSSGFSATLNIYGHEKVLMVLDTMCRMMLTPKDYSYIGNLIQFHELKDQDEISVIGLNFKFFDILSTKEKQFGFTTTLLNGKRLSCLGDEPCNTENRRYVEGVDYLMCEAFCLFSQKEIFHPYEKHHATALDAGKLASEAGAQAIILYHTEDKNLAERKELYFREAKEYFNGRIEVPDDLEEILL